MKKSEQICYIGNLLVSHSLKLIHGNGYLENVNMKGIDVNDEKTEDTHVKDSESIKTEIKIAESLIENCDSVIQSVKTKMTTI